MPQQKVISNIVAEKEMSKNLFVSDFYQVKQWHYDFKPGTPQLNGFNNCPCMVYVSKGDFQFNLSVKPFDMHSGYILLEKADCDYRMRPSVGVCTIFNFSNDFYKEFLAEIKLKDPFFFTNKNWLAVILQSTPETDYLHHQILSKLTDVGKLEMDNLVIEFFNQVAGIITNDTLAREVNQLSNKNWLTSIELAKEYINKNFDKDISLREVSANSFISLFHFSRLFKKITSFAPHQYLQNVRLKHGEMLLKNSPLPVTDIAFAAGFSSTAYFATAFKQKYKINPLQYRKMN